MDWSGVRLPPREWKTHEPSDPNPAHVPDPAFEPVTASRPATPEEIPRSAGWAVTAATRRGLAVEVLYAQGGGPRFTPVRGSCAVCGRACDLYVEDGAVQDHNLEIEKCPPDVAWTDEAGKRVCARCGRAGRPLKTAKMPAHAPAVRACTGGHQGPSELLAPVELEPVRTICVRIPGLGVGLWEDGRFVSAWQLLPGNVGVAKLGAREWLAVCREDPAGGGSTDGASGQDLPDAGVPEGGDERDTLF